MRRKSQGPRRAQLRFYDDRASRFRSGCIISRCTTRENRDREAVVHSFSEYIKNGDSYQRLSGCDTSAADTEHGLSIEVGRRSPGVARARRLALNLFG